MRPPLHEVHFLQYIIVRVASLVLENRWVGTGDPIRLPVRVTDSIAELWRINERFIS